MPFAAISRGFPWRGERISFFSTFEGVYEPKQLQVGALSVRTTIASRYDDERISDDWVWYDYSPLPGRRSGAYGRRCSVCDLGESPVLDGAHLVPDREEPGEPRVSNGLSLCALHHRAFDRDLLGVTPDLEVHVFRGRLERPEEEPTRVLTGFHGRELRLPEAPDLRPDPELVELRWEAAREG